MIEKVLSEDIFPLHPKHNHSSCIVEAPDRSLLVCWYRGSGERTADDVSVIGSRKAPGGKWSEPFPLADTKGFPDTNPILAVDPRGRLWCFWATQLDNRWESTLLKFKRARDWGRGNRPPNWETEGIVHLKPDDEKFPQFVDRHIEDAWKSIFDRSDSTERAKLTDYIAAQRKASTEKLTRRLGWFGRCHVFFVGERMVLPLYSDGFDASLFAWSTDDGESWECSLPMLGPAPVQPSVLKRRDGTLVALCRNNGPAPQRMLVSESKDDGRTWSLARHNELPNPGASVEGVVLADGRWLLCGNDTEEGRHSLAFWISENEGRSWTAPWNIERASKESGLSWHYPSLIQTRDGLVHLTCSHFTPGGKTMRHEVFKV